MSIFHILATKRLNGSRSVKHKFQIVFLTSTFVFLFINPKPKITVFTLSRVPTTLHEQIHCDGYLLFESCLKLCMHLGLLLKGLGTCNGFLGAHSCLGQVRSICLVSRPFMVVALIMVTRPPIVVASFMVPTPFIVMGFVVSRPLMVMSLIMHAMFFMVMCLVGTKTLNAVLPLDV